MLASIINVDGDIEVFLSDQEIDLLKNNTLNGKIFELKNTNKKYSLEILLEKKKELHKSGNGIGTEIQNNKYLIYISDVVPITSYYKRLKENGWIGTRYGRIKIDVLSESFAKQDETFSKDYKWLQIRKI